MIVTISIFCASLFAAVLMLSVKSLTMRGMRIPLVTGYTSKTDKLVMHIADRLKAKGKDMRHKALLKFHDIVYDSFIPWTQRKYRWFASLTYRLHRKIWSTLEYSKQSSHKVSSYLRKLGEEEQKKEVQEVQKGGAGDTLEVVVEKGEKVENIQQV